MASKKILLLLNSDRYAHPLIGYLAEQGKKFRWKLRIGCLSDADIASRIAEERFAGPPDVFCVEDIEHSEQAVKKSDLVIALLSDAEVVRIADFCIAHKKTMISPTRLTKQMAMRRRIAKEANTLILMDCGFSPGLDHITAKKVIDNIHTKGGKITAFKTCSGSFVSDEESDNPLGFKLSEPIGDQLNAGRHTNRYLVNGQLQHIPYFRLFEKSEAIDVADVPGARVIPEGDSLYYRRIYDLGHAHTVVKGKIVPHKFDRIWHLLIQLGLTESGWKVDLCGKSSYRDFLASLLPCSDSASLEDQLMAHCGADICDIEKLRWLGLFDDQSLPANADLSPAGILQHLLERKLSGTGADRDCVVMKHDAEYEFRNEHYRFSATFTLRGDDMKQSALALVMGYTCGVAAKCILLGKIETKGVHIPVIPEIYDPLLNELEDLGIAFQVDDEKVDPALVVSAS